MKGEIILDKVYKEFSDGTVAVRDVTLTVAAGEFFILLGPSGCGKSTLLNMIIGLEDISGGSVKVDGKIVNDLDPRERNMAMVFQSYALYPHMTVRQNMAFPLKMAGMQKEKIEHKVTGAAAVLELEDLLDRFPRALSGGQRQRVAMGRAIVREPRAFLLDEPLSNLDAKLRVQMRAEIANLQKKLDVTTVYVTHDQTEAMTLGDRMALLRKGKVQQVGTPRELYTAPCNLFVAGFIGSPAMNFLPAVVEDNHLQLPMMRIPLEQLPKGKDIPEKCIVGLRPEHIDCLRKEDHQGHIFKAEAEMVEWLGADAYVHYKVDAKDWPDIHDLPEELDRKISKSGRIPMTARLDPEITIHAGENINLGVNLEKLHIFAADAEQESVNGEFP